MSSCSPAMQRALRLPRHISRRILPSQTSATRTYSSQSPFTHGPSPPRLPKEEQEIFDRLQRQSTGAFSTPRVNQSPDSSTSPNTSTSAATPSISAVRMQINQSPDSTSTSASDADSGSGQEIRFESGAGGKIKDGDEFHPNMRRGAPPEFEGDVNPKTGEVGGPKNEPLRWGTSGDWSFNGRVTDF